jgi:hypothetical protein
VLALLDRLDVRPERLRVVESTLNDAYLDLLGAGTATNEMTGERA